MPSCPDANVQGVALSVKLPEQHVETTSARLSFRPGLPLQSTLFQCAEAVAPRGAVVRSAARYPPGVAGRRRRAARLRHARNRRGCTPPRTRPAPAHLGDRRSRPVCVDLRWRSVTRRVADIHNGQGPGSQPACGGRVQPGGGLQLSFHDRDQPAASAAGSSHAAPRRGRHVLSGGARCASAWSASCSPARRVRRSNRGPR